MDVKWLDDFLCLAECRSFTRASQARHTSQSGLSRRIQSLEHWVGAPLVNRGVQPLQLTEAGERFLPHAANLRTALLAARSIGAGPAAEQDGAVTLAVVEGLESGVLSALLARIRNNGVGVSVRAVARGADAGPASLLDGEADLWLVPQHADSPLSLDAPFEAVTVAQDMLSPVCAADTMGRATHSLPGHRERPAALLEYRRTDCLAQAAAMALSAGPMPVHTKHAGAADSLHSLRSMAIHGMGIAFLPESMVREELRRRELVRVDTRWSAPLEIQLVRLRGDAIHNPREAANRIWRCLAPAVPVSPPPFKRFRRARVDSAEWRSEGAAA